MPSALLPWVAGRTAEAGFPLWFPGLRGVQCEGTRTHLLSVLLPQERTAEGQPLPAAVFMRPAGAISGRGAEDSFYLCGQMAGRCCTACPLWSRARAHLPSWSLCDSKEGSSFRERAVGGMGSKRKLEGKGSVGGSCSHLDLWRRAVSCKET